MPGVWKVEKQPEVALLGVAGYLGASCSKKSPCLQILWPSAKKGDGAVSVAWIVSITKDLSWFHKVFYKVS